MDITEVSILHHIGIVLGLIWILSQYSLCHPIVYFVSFIYLYQVNERYTVRLQRRLQFEERKQANQKRVLSDSETVRWLNHAVEKIWPICMEQIASQKMLLPIIPWFLDKYKPWTAKKAVVQHMYLGRNPPMFTEIRVLSQSADDDHLVLELGMSFLSADDMSAILAVKLRKRLGFGMWAKMHITGMHVEGKVLVGVKFLRHWPFLGRLRVCFVEPPYFQMTVKPIFNHGVDVTELPGIAGWLDKILAVAFEQTLVEPNMLVVDVEKFVSAPTETWFSMDEKRPIAFVKVEIMEAADMKPSDLNGLADPYVKGQLGQYRFRTKIQKKTLTPKWQEEFKIPICTWESPNVLLLEVHDKDHFVDDTLGPCLVGEQRDSSGGQCSPINFPYTRRSYPLSTWPFSSRMWSLTVSTFSTICTYWLPIERDCSINIGDFRGGQRHDKWLPLQNIKTGRLHLAISVIDIAEKEGKQLDGDEVENNIEKTKAMATEATQQEPTSHESSIQASQMADQFEPIDIEGQERTGIWVHHPGSRGSQTWEPRKRSGSRRPEIQIQREVINSADSPTAIASNCNGDSSSSSSSYDENPEGNRAHPIGTIKKNLMKLSSVFSRTPKHESPQNKEEALPTPKTESPQNKGEVVPTPRVNVMPEGQKGTSVKFMVDENPNDDTETLSSDRSEADSLSKGHVRGMAKSILKQAGKSAHNLKHALSRKDSKKTRAGPMSCITEGEASQGSDSIDDESPSSSKEYSPRLHPIPAGSDSSLVGNESPKGKEENVTALGSLLSPRDIRGPPVRKVSFRGVDTTENDIHSNKESLARDVPIKGADRMDDDVGSQGESTERDISLSGADRRDNDGGADRTNDDGTASGPNIQCEEAEATSSPKERNLEGEK